MVLILVQLFQIGTGYYLENLQQGGKESKAKVIKFCGLILTFREASRWEKTSMWGV